MARVHITGASGTGASTLGMALADRLGVPHLDTDDFYWLPTNPPFTTKRPAAERIALLSEKLVRPAGWVLSGCALNWGEPFEPLYDFIVFLTLDPNVRMDRIRRRELARYGDRIQPGGDMTEISSAFLAWAAAYDTAGEEQRSRVAHEAWLAALTTPVIRLDSTAPTPTLVDAVLSSLRVDGASIAVSEFDRPDISRSDLNEPLHHDVSLHPCLPSKRQKEGGI